MHNTIRKFQRYPTPPEGVEVKFLNGYVIYSNGKVYSSRSGMYVGFTQKVGYRAILDDKTRRVHLLQNLVANLFLPNPSNYKFIKFKDGNRKNCAVDNLEWVEKRVVYKNTGI